LAIRLLEGDEALCAKSSAPDAQRLLAALAAS
jgi:hypothetical protein